MVKEINRLFCPSCKASIIKERNSFFPFCSPRCKDADLYHWLTGRYRISSPFKNDDGEDDEEDVPCEDNKD